MRCPAESRLQCPVVPCRRHETSFAVHL